LRTALAALVALVLLVLAIPPAVATAMGAKGVTVGGARWCAEGLCFRELARGEATVAAATLRWDRSLTLASVRTPPPSGGAGGEGLALPLARIDVTDLVVTGTPLPPLSGEVWPDRRLAGEGVTVEGRVVHAALETPYGTVTARAEPGDAGLAVEADCDCVLRDDRLGFPVFRAAVRARGHVEGKRFVGTVRVAEVPAEVDAVYEGGVLKGTARVVAPMADVYGAFAEMVPELATATLRGTLTADVAFRWPGDVEVNPTIEGFAVDGLVGDTFRWGTFTFWGRDADGEKALARGGEGTPDWLPLDRMGPWLPAAVIAAEDSRFRAHPGYDLDGMREAAAANVAARDVVRGGSTLTTYARKLRELLYAVELERELGKPRILELYLNVVEWGPGIRGAKQAARAYFLKSPEGLLPEEAAFLAGILRNPRTAWGAQYLRGKPDMARVRWILGNMPEAPKGAGERAVRFVPP
jgi:hypothetical protein